MKTLPLQEFYIALNIDKQDVKTFRQLALNTVQIIFNNGHTAIFKLEHGRIIKKHSS
jgi:hypothetical protein